MQKIKTPKGKIRVSVRRIEIQFLKLKHPTEQDQKFKSDKGSRLFPGEIRGLKIKFLSFQLLAAFQL